MLRTTPVPETLGDFVSSLELLMEKGVSPETVVKVFDADLGSYQPVSEACYGDGELMLDCGDELKLTPTYTVGVKIVDAIISERLVRAEYISNGRCRLIWSANAEERITRIVRMRNRSPRPFDRVHDITSGYGRILFPWCGRWLMVTDGWKLRWTDKIGFHNCSATGVE